MKEYEVIIDLASKTIVVEANDDQEAREKAFKEFKQLPDCDKLEEYWVGECDEVEE